MKPDSVDRHLLIDDREDTGCGTHTRPVVQREYDILNDGYGAARDCSVAIASCTCFVALSCEEKMCRATPSRSIT